MATTQDEHARQGGPLPRNHRPVRALVVKRQTKPSSAPDFEGHVSLVTLRHHEVTTRRTKRAAM